MQALQLISTAQPPAAPTDPQQNRRRGFDDLKQVCQLIRKSPSWVYGEIRAGRFPKARRIGGRAVGWLAWEIDEWVESREKAGQR